MNGWVSKNHACVQKLGHRHLVGEYIWHPVPQMSMQFALTIKVMIEVKTKNIVQHKMQGTSDWPSPGVWWGKRQLVFLQGFTKREAITMKMRSNHNENEMQLQWKQAISSTLGISCTSNVVQHFKILRTNQSWKRCYDGWVNEGQQEEPATNSHCC